MDNIANFHRISWKAIHLAACIVADKSQNALGHRDKAPQSREIS